MDYSGLFLRKSVLAGRWLAMDYTGFQASCNNIHIRVRACVRNSVSVNSNGTLVSDISRKLSLTECQRNYCQKTHMRDNLCET
jgi:hypothetical protein